MAMHTLSSTLIPTDIMQQLTSGKQLNENTTTKKLFTLIDKSSEHMSSSELQTFRKNLQKWGEAVQAPDTIKKIQDPILRSCLEKCASAQKMSSNFQVRNDAMLQFFNLFTTQNIQQKNLDTDHENYILNSSDFNTFVEHLDSPQQTIYADHHLQRFSPNFSQKYHYLREQASKTADHNALTQLEEEMTASFDHAFV
ncbi:MAG: hypothetical protein Q4B28_07705 [bacterium]|nr:hypothetical protein [bacterium]